MMSTLVEKLKYEQLVEFTDNFSEKNSLGNFQFGKVYRGIMEESMGTAQHVIVKIWKRPVPHYRCYQSENEERLLLEVSLLQNTCLKSHPGMIELYGYCWDEDSEILGSVYNCNPLDTLHNLIPKDSFTWLQRIKVAVRFGSFLKFLHTGYPAVKQCLVRNIAASHIAVDQEYNPKLLDFSLFSGGIFPDSMIYKVPPHLHGVFGYFRWHVAHTDKADSFAFGVLLLNLMTKRIDPMDAKELTKLLYDWAWERYRPLETDEYDNKSRYIKKFVYSFVDKSLAMDRDYCEADGRRITKLAMKCTYKDSGLSMKQVMKCLFKLQVVKNNLEFLELGPELQALITKREKPHEAKIKKSV